MNTLIDEELAQDERRMVSLISEIRDLRSKATESRHTAEPLEAQLKQWLELNQDELIDEHGLRAHLQSRSATRWNVSRMPAEIVMYLAKAGLLTVTTALFDMRRKNDGAVELDDAMRWRETVEGSKALLIEEIGK